MIDQPAAASLGNSNDVEYDAYLARVRARFALNTRDRPVFTTDAAGLWEKYLESFPEAERQHHNCNACHHFIKRYGHLVTIDNQGNTTPAVWSVEDAYGPYVLGVERMAKLVGRAKVTGVFLSEAIEFGQPRTGPWRHLHAHNGAIFTHLIDTSAQARAAKLQDYQTLRRGLQEFDGGVVAQAVRLLDSQALYRSEKVLGAAKWLQQVHAVRAGKVGAQEANVTWLAVATAPEGFCRPRSTMIGTLLEDIAKGLPVDDIARRFGAKMDEYQRPTAAPKAGQIAAAEKTVQAMGIAPALARRYAVQADLTGGIIWTPGQLTRESAAAKPAAAGGIFDHLKPAASAVPELDIPPKKVTWEKFARDVLPGAAAIEYRVPLVGPFCALTAAHDPAAPPILQWDTPEVRNTVSWSFPGTPARADEWSLQAGTLAPVRMIVAPPNLWHNDERFAHHGKGAFLLLQGAKDTRGQPGGGLFPEHLRSELHPYRSTIEAHLNKMLVVGAEDPATVGFGIGLMAGADFTETAAPKAAAAAPHQPAGRAPKRIHAILVVDDSGSMGNYIGAARSAVRSLLDGLSAMPGEVDVTFISFGDRASVRMERAHLNSAESLPQEITGSSGSTALNDAIGNAIELTGRWPDAADPDVSFFLGIVTDGEENRSRRYEMYAVRDAVLRVMQTGRWTVAFAGAGANPQLYARSIGIPEGNIKVFRASDAGFADLGASYASSTAVLSRSYASGMRASTSFFSAAPGRQAMGKDHPVLLVTNHSGARVAYELDRWE